jgi:hypothetical protein
LSIRIVASAEEYRCRLLSRIASLVVQASSFTTKCDGEARRDHAVGDRRIAGWVEIDEAAS